MNKENFLFVTALTTIVVMVALAISIAWVIPPHHVSDDYVEYDKRDTEADVRRKCKCNDTKSVTVYVNRTEPTHWTDPSIEEVLLHQRAKLPMTNDYKYPGIVSILIKKYADDETMLDFGGTGYIIKDEFVIAGSYCFRTIPRCAVHPPPASCTQFIRIRSGSPYWSMGGRLRKTTNYSVNANLTLVIFKVRNRFVEADEKPGIYPDRVSYRDNYTRYTLTGFFAANETWNQRYKVASSSKIYQGSHCGNYRKEVKMSQNLREDKFRPIITTCSDLSGFETERSLLDLTYQKAFFSWIMDILEYKDKHLKCRQWNLDLYPLGPACKLPGYHNLTKCP